MPVDNTEALRLANARDRLAHVLKERGLRVVFAESCTAGLCSATLAQVDGISNHLVGSAVTYRASLKSSWIGVSQDAIDRFTCESREVAEQMAIGVLRKSAEAGWSAAVVGHLADGQIGFIEVAIAEACESQTLRESKRFELQSGSRATRQQEAAALVLETLAETVTVADS